MFQLRYSNCVISNAQQAHLLSLCIESNVMWCLRGTGVQKNPKNCNKAAFFFAGIMWSARGSDNWCSLGFHNDVKTQIAQEMHIFLDTNIGFLHSKWMDAINPSLASGLCFCPRKENNCCCVLQCNYVYKLHIKRGGIHLLNYIWVQCLFIGSQLWFWGSCCSVEFFDCKLKPADIRRL